MDDNCILQLCDPDSLPLNQAIGLARSVSHFEPNLDATLSAYVCHLADSREPDPRLLQRALAVLYAVADSRRFAVTCRHVEEGGSPMVRAMFRWLLAALPRRVAQRHPTTTMTFTIPLHLNAR